MKKTLLLKYINYIIFINIIIININIIINIIFFPNALSSS